MSNETQFQEGMGDEQEGQIPTRLQALKQKATLMGISFSNNIGEEALAKKIENNEMFVIPKPLEIEELEKLLIDFGIAN